MLPDKIQKALNDQLNAELYSAYMYLSMNAYFHSIGLEGFANWMSQQAHEETLHALKFYDFINQRGSRVLLAQVDAPPVQWDSPLAVFEATLRHEQKVTALINDLVELAQAERDHATNIFLQWFVSEQVEEEESVGSVLDQLKLLGDNKSGLFLIDRELAQRQAPGTIASE
ncbi:ferritin [Thermodesulfobacteriota bacterium]